MTTSTTNFHANQAHRVFRRDHAVMVAGKLRTAEHLVKEAQVFLGMGNYETAKTLIGLAIEKLHETRGRGN